MREHMCLSCGRTFVRYNTLQRKCGLCSFNKTTRKPLKRMGKVAKEWSTVRNQWIKDNPPTHQGYYICYYCGKHVHIDEMQVDHKNSRTRSPESRYDPSNLVASCPMDNKRKGSMNAEEYLAKYYPKT